MGQSIYAMRQQVLDSTLWVIRSVSVYPCSYIHHMQQSSTSSSTDTIIPEQTITFPGIVNHLLSSQNYNWTKSFLPPPINMHNFSKNAIPWPYCNVNSYLALLHKLKRQILATFGKDASKFVNCTRYSLQEGSKWPLRKHDNPGRADEFTSQFHNDIEILFQIWPILPDGISLEEWILSLWKHINASVHLRTL